MKYISSLVVALLIAKISMAQVSENLASKLEGFDYFEVVTGKDDGKLPLLIVLHAPGSYPAKAIRSYDSVSNPVRIILPRGNFALDSGYSFVNPQHLDLDDPVNFKLARKTVDSLKNFAKAIQKRYNAKAIVCGKSGGGDLAFMLGRYHPEYVRAVINFAANFPEPLITSFNKGRSVNLPVYVFQGEADSVSPVTKTRSKIDRIGKKMDIQLVSYPGAGHDVSKEMKTDCGKLIDRYTVDSK